MLSVASASLFPAWQMRRSLQVSPRGSQPHFSAKLDIVRGPILPVQAFCHVYEDVQSLETHPLIKHGDVSSTTETLAFS
jgi:hypothetical protein